MLQDSGWTDVVIGDPVDTSVAPTTTVRSAPSRYTATNSLHAAPPDTPDLLTTPAVIKKLSGASAMNGVKVTVEAAQPTHRPRS